MSKQSPYHKRHSAFYSSKQWRVLRDFIRARDKVCARCLGKGIITQGYEVHHIKSIETNPELALDETNLELLCKRCHDSEHERVSDFIKFMEGRA